MENLGHPLVVVFLTLVGVAIVGPLLLVLAAGGSSQRVTQAARVFGHMLKDPGFAGKVLPLLEPPRPQEIKPPKLSGVPLRMLALLQREGRLLDFLLEDIQSYPDPQIGAAVRDIHRKCHETLKEHLVLEPVLTQAEGSSVDVPAGFDPSAIRLTGNVTGDPPFRGTLQHHGWRVKEYRLAAPPEGQDELVLQPAEVELP